MSYNVLFFLQIAAILIVSKGVASLFQRLNQPAVVGEMISGLTLGPTILGHLAPSVYRSIFPAASLNSLESFSQVGIAIFVFLIGVRTDFTLLRRQSKVALVTSGTSIVLPFVMGLALARSLYEQYGRGDRAAFALFIGTAISITAFPVLARMLLERDLVHTRLGSLALACAAVDDVAAWILLAAIGLRLRHQASPHFDSWEPLGFFSLAALSIFLVSKLTSRLKERRAGVTVRDYIPLFVSLALGAGALAEGLGLHCLIGAYVAGLLTPRAFRQQLIDKLEGLTVVLFLPIFFALSGIRTDLFIGINGGLRSLLAILFVAIVSKWGGTMIGSKCCGLAWGEACQLGLMVNCRGLVELIVLNIGLERGILSPALFSLMVAMALVTTFMALPLSDWISRVAVSNTVYIRAVGPLMSPDTVPHQKQME